MIRAFIAVDMPDGFRSDLKKVQQKFAPVGQLKFTDDFHCTLKFLGDIHEHQIEMVKEALSGIKTGPLDVVMKGLGVFPDIKKARVIWAGLSDGLNGLHKQIDEALSHEFGEEKRKFSPHVTFARIKNLVNRGKLERFISEGIDEKEFIVTRFRLYKSTLTEKGSEFQVLEEFDLVS